MKSDERDEIVKLYEERYVEHGYNMRTLGWRGPEDQLLRFKVLSDIADLRGTTICDIGCGFGDLAVYLEQRFGEVGYIGIDISPSLVEEARLRHPQLDFRCLDILESDFADRADYFLLSGALNYKVRDNWELTSAMMTRMFTLSRKGIAVNFLSSYVNFIRPHNYHHRPEDVFGFGKSLSKNVAIRHDYPLWEFTVYVYKEG